MHHEKIKWLFHNMIRKNTSQNNGSKYSNLLELHCNGIYFRRGTIKATNDIAAVIMVIESFTANSTVMRIPKILRPISFSQQAIYWKSCISSHGRCVGLNVNPNCDLLEACMTMQCTEAATQAGGYSLTIMLTRSKPIPPHIAIGDRNYRMMN